MTKQEDPVEEVDPETKQVLEAVRAAYDDDAVAGDIDGARLTVLHAGCGPGEDWTIYAISEEPHMGWLTIVAKQSGKAPQKVVLSGRGPLMGVREAIDRILAGRKLGDGDSKTAEAS